ESKRPRAGTRRVAMRGAPYTSPLLSDTMPTGTIAYGHDCLRARLRESYRDDSCLTLHKMKDLIVSILNAAIERARAAGQLATAPSAAASVEAPKDPAHGDAASNAALVMARAEKKPPRAIAEIIRANLELPPEVAEASVAGAGFINFRMAPAFWHRELRGAAAEGERFWRPQIGAGRKVQVEFLSANPTWLLNVGHGRDAIPGGQLS